MNRKVWLALVLVGVISGIVSAESKIIGRVTVEAGKYDRVDTPVCVGLKGVVGAGDGFAVYEVDGEKSVPCQVIAGERLVLCWVLTGKTAAGSKRVFEVRTGESDHDLQVSVKKEDGFVEIIRGGKKAVRYNSAIVPVPEGANKIYERGGFIHPLWSPDGHELSRIHPKDHYHHLGLWGPWTKSHVEGREIDFWNLAKGQGTIRFVKFNSVTSGPVFGGFVAEQEHLDLKSTKSKIAIKEKLGVKVWNVGPGFLVDYTSKQVCALDVPITLDAYRYGGFGFRATEKWKGSDRGYLTSEGKGIADADGTTAKWCDVYGPMGDGRSGVVFMSHVENRAFPEPIRIWGKTGFNETFFNFCPIKRTKWMLEPGEENVRRYRLYVYDGKMTAEHAERLWQDFAYPPKTVFVPLG